MCPGMEGLLENVRELGTGQRVRLIFADGATHELRVAQEEYVPNQRFRLELTNDDSLEGARYWLGSSFIDGSWTSVSVKRYDRDDRAWKSMGELSEIAPLETYQTMKSADMNAQEDTGNGPNTVHQR